MADFLFLFCCGVVGGVLGYWVSKLIFGPVTKTETRVEARVTDNKITLDKDSILVDHPDSMAREVITKAWITGKAHYGVRDNEGNVTIKPLEEDKP
jgi:hypothetical protein